MFSIYIKRNGKWIRAPHPKPNIFASTKEAEKAIEQWFSGYFINYEWKIDYYMLRRQIG